MASHSDTENEKIDRIQHNNNIDAQIVELTKEKEKYERVQTRATEIQTALQEYSTYSKGIGELLDNLIITGRTFDDGAFKLIGSNLSSMIGTFSSIISKCANKRNEIESEIEALSWQKL